MIKRDNDGHGVKFDPVGLLRFGLELVGIIVTISFFLGGMKTDIALNAKEISTLKECDTRLEKKVDDNKSERELQLNKIEQKLDKIYDLLMEK